MKEVFYQEKTGLRIKGFVDPEEMKLFIDASVEPQRPVTVKEIEEILLHYTFSTLLHGEVIKDVAHTLSQGQPIKERRVAKGVPPQPGADGKVIFLARRLSLKAKKVSSRYLGTPLELENIEKGRHVARIYKPKSGTPGKSALAKDLPAPVGKAAVVTWDESLSVLTGDDHYDVLVAERDGFLGEEQNALAILDELSFDGDFDYRYGSVDFCGTIRVKGDVKTDSFLAGRKGVFIGGGVHSTVVIRSADGPIEITAAINGGSSSKFEPGSYFTCSVIQQAIVEGKGDVTIKKEAHGATIHAHGRCLAETAHLFGMELSASGDIWVGKLGNQRGVQTTVKLCTDVETGLEYRELVHRVDAHEKAIQLLELHLGPVAKHPERIGLLQPLHRIKVEGLLKKYRDVKKSHETLVSEKKAMRKNATEMEKRSVNIKQMVYPGVVLIAGEAKTEILDEKRGPTALIFNKGETELQFGEYQKLEDPSEKKEVKK